MATNREYHRAYYLKHKERHYAQSKAWRQSHPEHSLWKAAKGRALNRGLPFDLEVSDIVIPELCPILGVRLEPRSRFAPTLDRKKPLVGYVKGNVWVISKIANLMKSDASQEELERFADWIKHLKH